MTHGKLLELIEAARTDETAFSHLVHHVLDLRYALSNIAEDANEAAKKYAWPYQRQALIHGDTCRFPVV